LSVEIGPRIVLRDGSPVFADVLLLGYGAANGMLIVEDFSTISGHADEIVASGFGYSCMSDPGEAETVSSSEIKEVLADWGRCTN
jgi:hypothetical protein